MAIVYTWTFNPLEVTLSQDGLTNVVKTVHWRLTGEENGVSETVYGTEGMEDPLPGSFIPYDNLTLETVQNWVEGKMGEERVQAMKDSIANSINAKNNPVSASMVAPWAAEPVVEEVVPPVEEVVPPVE